MGKLRISAKDKATIKDTKLRIRAAEKPEAVEEPVAPEMVIEAPIADAGAVVAPAPAAPEA